MTWLSGWSHAKDVNVTGQTGAGTDYQVELEIGDSAGGDFHLEGNCTNFPQDIEVTDNDGTTLLDFWIEDLTADPLVMRVKVDDDLGSNQTVRVYYGKSGATTNSDGAATFPTLFDDFEDGNVSDWTIESGAAFAASTTQVKSGTYSGKENGQGGNGVQAYKTFTNQTSKFVIEFDVYPEIETDNHLYMMIEKTGGDAANSVWLDMRAASPDWRYSDGTAHVFIDPAAEQWYHWEIHVDPPNDRFSLWSDDVNKVTDGGSLGDITTGCSAIGLASLWAVSDGVYIDNLFIRKYNDPEPAFSSAGAEQNAPIGAIMNQFQKANIGADLYNGALSI